MVFRIVYESEFELSDVTAIGFVFSDETAQTIDVVQCNNISIFVNIEFTHVIIEITQAKSVIQMLTKTKLTAQT